jgi:pilus assembly protein CpaB
MPGDWILVGKLTGKGDIGAAANVPKGMRALTISVDATQTHSGMLRPGNRVDIQLTYDCQSATACRRKVARTILQYVEVFAVDDRVYGNDQSPDGATMAKNISVLVTPEQSNMLCLARSMGTLSTTLRSNGDTEETVGAEVSDEIFENSGESNVANPSVMDAGSGLNAGSGPVLFEENPPTPGIDQHGQQAATSPDPGGSMPVIELAQADVPRNTWTMEIYEGGNVRLESIELPEASDTISSSSTDVTPGFWGFLGLKSVQNP